MRIGRLAIASLAFFLIIALIWNGILIIVVLHDANSLIAPLRRANLNDFMWLCFLTILVTTSVFYISATTQIDITIHTKQLAFSDQISVKQILTL
jgi:hypothetical protein